MARCVALIALAGFGLGSLGACLRKSVGSRDGKARIVSLSPALTETLFALDAGGDVVGISDFCHEPKAVEALPRTGSVFAPRLEAIVALEPSLILSERFEGSRFDDLRRVGSVFALPWLTYEDVLTSTLALGKKIRRQAEAEALVARYRSALAAKPSATAPRVLVALAQTPGQLQDVYYVRRNSIHGRVLEAAGARNAVQEDVVGPPRLPLERLFSVDPDILIVLEPSARRNEAILEDFRKLTGLRAVREGRLGWVGAPEAEVPGPRIVNLVGRLRAEIRELTRASADGELAPQQGTQ
jgi:iron complex transport system substrate-binding protein